MAVNNRFYRVDQFSVEPSTQAKAKYALMGAGVMVTLQFCWTWIRRRWSSNGRAFSTAGYGGGGGNGDGSKSRMLTPLHHLDTQKLKARSSASANILRSPEQGDSPIFQIVLTGGPSGGKSR